MMKNRSFRFFPKIIVILFFLVLLFFLPFQIFAANLEIPLFMAIFDYNLATGFTPYIYSELSFSGGLKYNILINFSFFYTDSSIFSVLDTDSQTQVIEPSFNLSSLYASIPNLFDFLDIIVFYGYYKKFCTGSAFQSPFYTLQFFVEGSNNFQYSYYIQGTGLEIYMHLLDDQLNFSLFGYQKKGQTQPLSFDIHSQINLINNIEIELYGGTDAFTIYRAGVAFSFVQDNFEITLNLGSQDLLNVTSIMDLYLVFEQSAHFQQFSQIFSIFSKPAYYNETALTESEKNTILFNMDLAYNNLYRTFYAGMLIKIELTDFAFSELVLIPHTDFLLAGMLWKIAVDINLINTTTYFEGLTVSFETKF